MPRHSEEAKERFRAERMDLYYDRKENEECVQCGADLPEDAESVMCEDCLEMKREASLAYALSDHGRAMQRKYERERKADWRKRNAAGELICCHCGGKLEAARKGRRNCEKCTKRNTRATTEWRRRKRMREQGITPIQCARDRREAAKREERKRRKPRPSTKYVPIDEVLESTRYRLLSALARLDWCGARDILEAARVSPFDASDRTERDRFCKALERYTKDGLVTYRSFYESGSLTGKRPTGTRNGGTYRITSKGLEALAVLKDKIAKGIAC